MKKSWWVLLIVVVLGVAGFFTYRAVATKRASKNTSSLQTATVTRGTVATSISASGTVRSAQTATVSWQASGKVGKIFVELGQQVEYNQELAALDANTLSQSIIQAQTDLINAQTALDELKKPQPLKIAQAEVDLKNAQTALDNLLNPSETAISQAELAVITAQTALDTAQKAVDRLKYARGSKDQITSAEANYTLAQNQVNKLLKEYEQVPGSPAIDPAKAEAYSNLTAAETRRDIALANLNWLNGKPDPSEVSDKKTKLAVAQAQFDDAQTNLAKLKAPTQTDITLAQARVEDAQATLDAAKLGATADELTIAQTRVTLAEAALGQARLTAPFTGTITDITVLPGDLVSSGKAAFRIDNLSKLYVDLSVSEFDFPSIQLGQAANVTFDAISTKTYTGIVTKVGKVATVSQGVVNFPVTVQITDADESIIPGMTAGVAIIMAQHENVLVVPNQAIQISGGQRVVTVLYQGQQIQVPVTIGLAGDSETEISGDVLKEGDVLVLNITSTTNSRNGNRSVFIGGGGLGGEFGPP